MRSALVFGYGQKKDGWIDAQTEDRCSKAALLYCLGKIQMIHLTVSASKNDQPMTYGMRVFLEHMGVPTKSIVIDRRGRNTAGELDIFLTHILPKERVVLISTWYHIPRILWLTLWRISPRRVTVGIAWRHAHFKGDVLKEFLKFTNAVFRPFKSSKTVSNPPA